MKYDIVFLHFPVYLLGFSNFRSFKNRFKFLKNFRFKKFSFSDQATVFHVPFDPLVPGGRTDRFFRRFFAVFLSKSRGCNRFFLRSRSNSNKSLHAVFCSGEVPSVPLSVFGVRFVALDQFQPFQKRNVSARRRLFRIVNSTNARRAIPPTHFFDLVDRPSVIFDSLITQHNLKVNVSKKVPFVVIRRFRH